MTSRKKPGVAFWATVVVVVIVIYAASVGPVYWIGSRIPATNTMAGGRVLHPPGLLADLGTAAEYVGSARV